MVNRIKILSNFITQEDSNKIISIINDQKNNGNLKPFKDNDKVLTASETPEVIEIIKKYSLKSVQEHMKQNKLFKPLYTCEAFANLWGWGSRALEHVDTHDEYDFLQYTTVIYLNDNFKGGHLKFPNQEYEYKPKALDGVMFPCGGTEYPHEVTMVLNLNRYTIAIWHTDRLDKADARYN
jgi:hypothetical protein